MIHTNSLLAKNQHSTLLSKREKLVLEVYRKQHPTPLSDRFVMRLLGSEDPNFVRPRITALIRKNLIKETGKLRCIHTKCLVRHCRIADEYPQIQMFYGEGYQVRR